MHLIEWLVSAWPKRCLTATWTNLYLQGSGKVCEIHQSMSRLLPPCTPERTQHHQLTTWPFWQLEASMIITCNYIFQIYRYTLHAPIYIYIHIYHIYSHVHESTVYLYSSSFTVKRKTPKKLWNDEDWRTMPNPYPLVSTEPPRLQDLFYQVWDDRIVAEFQLFECWEL